jgi:hypothetical protein
VIISPRSLGGLFVTPLPHPLVRTACGAGIAFTSAKAREMGANAPPSPIARPLPTPTIRRRSW